MNALIQSRTLRLAVLSAFTWAAIAPAQFAYAELADLAQAPLATSATAVVKPNIMFILDDSGSMGRDGTPDYVDDSGTPAGCYDAGDDSTGTITGAADACGLGDPPYMTPDYNSQYYNPEFTYTPAVNFDGSSKPTQNAANTTNWTAVLTDGFNIQNRDQEGNSVTTKNLVTGYPDRYWCQNQSDTAPGANCVRNADYTYPDAAYPYGNTGGGSRKIVGGAPYYYRIVPTEYCTTEDLTTCTASTVPTGSFVFPATVRWCNSTALTTCQARRLGSFVVPKYLGTVNPGSAGSPAVSATGTVRIDDSGSNNSVNVNSVTVNGVELISTTVTAAGGTNTTSERQTAARDLCAAINAGPATATYRARNSGSSPGSTCSSAGSTTVTIEAIAAGPAPNGFSIVVGASSAGTTAATVTVTVSNSGTNNAGSLTSITINGVAVVGAGSLPINAPGGTNSNSERNAVRNALVTAVNAFASTPEYSAVSTGTTGQLQISAAISEGSAANGRVVLIGTTGTLPLTITDCAAPAVNDALCGGVTSGGIPVTVTNMAGGADAVPAATAFRQGIGTWARTDIVSSNNSYPKAATRSDCAGASCTYAEEMTNFSNWYAYYRTRMQMMKSSAGRAFVSLGNDYRVGFVTINPGSPVSSTKYLAVTDFATTAGGQKDQWYTKFYGRSASGSTPLREALSRVGRYYAGITTGINSSMSGDPIQYSCQQNFAILTTDGYWNGNAGQQKTDGTAIGNQDNVDSGFSTRAPSGSFPGGAYDGGLAGSTSTLADVAMYYYKTDLRASPSTGALGTDVSQDNVPGSGKDAAPHQHMTTFTLGLGLDGNMRTQSDYETAATGDYRNIVTAATGCAWQAAGATCNWPVPAADTPSALDDLWHTAVNGRGTYFSAQDPNALYTGLVNALSAVQVRTGAAAASATSSPNITETDRFIYSSTYRTQAWDGEIVAQLIDTTTGAVIPDIVWSAQTLLDARILTPSSDDRTIYVFDPDAASTTKVKAFSFASLTSAERLYFTDKICAPAAAPLAQCTTLPAADQVEANKPQKLIPWLRGQTENNGFLYRNREHVLGDPVNATPAYVRVPTFAFADAVTPDYATFKAANAARQSVLYVAANDGMLHALNGDTGQEIWAFIPKSVFPFLYRLAATNYANNHKYYVDGSPTTMDVFDSANSAWKTILVGGLNEGGRGYYALDVTDPANPKGLWEFCADASLLCTVTDADLGYTYGNPVITKRTSDNRWVVLVTSGYNNAPDSQYSVGNGHGFLYVLDALTGSVLQKIDTAEGDITTPLGLGKISAFADNASQNNKAKWVYGGDLQGNVWRFDLTVGPATVMKIATLKDASGPPRPQSITTKPELGEINGYPMVFVATGRYLGTNDLVDGATLIPALPYAYQNSIYAFKDTATAHGDLRTKTTSPGKMIQQTITQTDPNTRTTSNLGVDWTGDLGWYVDLNPTQAPALAGGYSPGERVNVDPQLVLGTLLVAANVPADTACSVGGDSWLYQLSYLTGTYVSTSLGNVAATKVASALTVGFVTVRLPSGAIKTIITDTTGVKLTEGVNVGAGSGGGRRVSWRELIQ